MRLLLPLLSLGTALMAELPPTLSQTGYRPGGRGLVAFEPAHPLWTDGLGKARFVRLPSSADGRNPQAWQFPVGTTFWKDFELGPRRLETRVVRLGRKGWEYGTYLWRGDQREADLAPMEGRRDLARLPGGLAVHAPAVADCRRCHENGGSPVLGFDALQLDAAQQRKLAKAGLLRLPASGPAPLALHGQTPQETAALSVLHGNCGSCHRPEGPLGALGLHLRHPASGASPVLPTARLRAALVPFPGAAHRITPGQPQASALVRRMERRGDSLQMPPIGTALPDVQGLAKVRTWIAGLK